MNKLSKKSIDKINLFLNENEFNYVTLSKREVKTLYNTYKKATSEIFELENNNEQLLNQNKQKDKAIDECIEYLEKFIPIDKDTILMREGQRDYLLEKLQQAKGGCDE